MHWCLLSLPRLGKIFSYDFIERFSCTLFPSSRCFYVYLVYLQCCFMLLFSNLKIFLNGWLQSWLFSFLLLELVMSSVAFRFWNVETSNIFQSPALTFSHSMIWFSGFVEVCVCVLLNLIVSLHTLSRFPWQIFCYPGGVCCWRVIVLFIVLTLPCFSVFLVTFHWDLHSCWTNHLCYYRGGTCHT